MNTNLSISSTGFGINSVRKNIAAYAEILKTTFGYPVATIPFDDGDHHSFSPFSQSDFYSSFNINGVMDKFDDKGVNLNGQRVYLFFDEGNKVVIVFEYNTNDLRGYHYATATYAENIDKFTDTINLFLQKGEILPNPEIKKFDGHHASNEVCQLANEFFAK